MKVFLDECIDWRLSRDLIGHEVKTAITVAASGSVTVVGTPP